MNKLPLCTKSTCGRASAWKASASGKKLLQNLAALTTPGYLLQDGRYVILAAGGYLEMLQDLQMQRHMMPFTRPLSHIPNVIRMGGRRLLRHNCIIYLFFRLPSIMLSPPVLMKPTIDSSMLRHRLLLLQQSC